MLKGQEWKTTKVPELSVQTFIVRDAKCSNIEVSKHLNQIHQSVKCLTCAQKKLKGTGSRVVNFLEI